MGPASPGIVVRIWLYTIVSGSTPNDRALGGFVRQPRLSDRVAKDILETIVAQRLQPGDPLPPERELGKQFGVSRTVVREAVRALEARGLVDVRVGSRIRVAAVDPQTVVDSISHFVRTARLDASGIAALRDSLEAIAARMAASHATDHDRELIDRAVDGEDAAFRRAVMAASHNELLTVLAEAIGELAHRPPSSGLDGQRPVADAIAQGDPDGAEQAMRALGRQPG
jgi:GntR family transcriptional repressor for pyruvate dehydrogenase complex